MVSTRQILGRLGLGGAPRTYGTEVVTFDLPGEGRVRYARWLHPRETPKSIDQAEVDQLRRFLSPGDVAIDIGAHTGDTALPLGLAVGPSGLVLALEPNPYVYGCLVENAGLNPDKARIEPLPFAATRQDGPVEFRYSDAGFCNGGSQDGVSWWRHGHTFALTVQGRNLARYLETERADLVDRIRFIKVDAEGHDHAVLETLTGVIERSRPFIRAEVFKYSTEPQRRAFLAFVRGLGYDIVRIDHETVLHGPAIDDHSNVMEPAHYDIFCSPQSCPGS